MAEGYRSVYDGRSLASRAARVGFGGDVDDLRDERAGHEYARMAAARSNLDYRTAVDGRSRAVFDSAWESIRGDRDGTGALSAANEYAQISARAKVLTEAGKYDEAYRFYGRLSGALDGGSDVLFDVSTADPSSTGRDADAHLQTGAENIVKRNFDMIEARLPDGTVATLGDMYRDGQSYKRMQRDAALKANFSEGVASAVSSEDPFVRGLAERITGPVLSAQSSVHPYRIQLNDIGSYVFGDGGEQSLMELRSLRDELGDRGLSRLVDDAVTKGAADGTYLDRMKTVRSIVAAQRAKADAKDPALLVHSALDAFDRTMAVASKGDRSGRSRRFVSKLMSIAVDEADGNIDFDDDGVREQLDGWVSTARMADAFGISLLSDGKAGGLPLRKAVAGTVSVGSDPSEDNPRVRIDNAFALAKALVSSGAAPAEGLPPESDAGLLGGTAGDALVDAARRRMATDLLREHLLPGIYAGTREDVTVSSLGDDASARARLAESWGESISLSLGLSKPAGRHVAGRLADRMFTGSGAIPVGLGDELSASAFDRSTPPQVARELRRYVKARNLVDPVRMAELTSGYRAMLADPLVGYGVRDPQQMSSMMAGFEMKLAAMLENGEDVAGVALAMGRHGLPYRPTGNWVLPDGTAVSDVEYRKGRRVVPAGDGKSVKEVRIDVSNAIPEIAKLRTLVNLDEVSYTLPRFPGSPEDVVKPLSWSGNRAGFLASQSYLARLAAENDARRKAHADRAAKSADKALDDDLPPSSGYRAGSD